MSQRKKKPQPFSLPGDGRAKPDPVAAPGSATSSPPSPLPPGYVRQSTPFQLSREAVESVVVAFLLAFLFRTFQAEAYVIPTGSMAPSLLGSHKSANCPQCGFRYLTSASKDDTEQDFILFGQRKKSNENVTHRTCPECRFRVGDGQDQATYTGDRIMVAKFPYEFGEVQRWDVAVFKYPGKAVVNYIKRCVGLPGETLKIHRGDLYTQRKVSADSEATGETAWEICRKPHKKLLSMLQLVHDNRYLAKSLDQAGWPRRWVADSLPEAKVAGAQGAADEASTGTWKNEGDNQAFTVTAGASTAALRYRHFAPGSADWERLQTKGAAGLAAVPAKPQLVTDYYEYNDYRATGSINNPAYEIAAIAKHWVGDLAFDVTLEPSAGQGEVTLELVEGGVRFQCQLDLAKQQATLSALDKNGQPVPDFAATAKISLPAGSASRVIFANVDDRIDLWIWNGWLDHLGERAHVAFTGKTTYDGDQLGTRVPFASPANPGDLQPVAILAKNCQVRAESLRVLRDVYYIHNAVHTGRLPVLVDSVTPFGKFLQEADAREIFSNPARWDEFAKMPSREFKIPPGHYLMLGDNSPASSDGRLWESQGVDPFVPRELLLGEALLIYYPHSNWQRFGLIH